MSETKTDCRYCGAKLVNGDNFWECGTVRLPQGDYARAIEYCPSIMWWSK